MTESKIFEILLNKHYDFPKLHEEAASTIAKNLADIIYDTLKLKSSLPTTKRLNTLSFLKTLSAKRENHINVNQDNYEVFIKSCVSHSETDSFGYFIVKVERDLKHELPGDLCSEISEFYKRKSEKHQRNIKKIETIKKYDQKALEGAKFSTKITRNISYYETSESIIKKLLSCDSPKNQTVEELDITDLKYRKSQVKFAYSLVYLRQWAPLMTLLKRFSKYTELTKLETDFLHYLNENLGSGDNEIRLYLLNNFTFIYECTLIAFCSKIIQLKSHEVEEFFEMLLFNEKFIIIKSLCSDQTFKLKVQNLLYELYAYSYCNNILLKFINFL